MKYRLFPTAIKFVSIAKKNSTLPLQDHPKAGISFMMSYEFGGII